MKNIIKVYSHDEAPEGSVYINSKVERNGIIDLGVKNYLIPKLNEKQVHFYLIPS